MHKYVTQIFQDTRPSSETGARPKTSSIVSSTTSVVNSSSGSKQSSVVTNGENLINNEVITKNDDHVSLQRSQIKFLFFYCRRRLDREGWQFLKNKRGDL